MTDAAKIAALIEQAKIVRLRAYAPYSKYLVGAAILTTDGRVVIGSNVENASFGLTVCAERSAIFSAISQGKAYLHLFISLFIICLFVMYFFIIYLFIYLLLLYLFMTIYHIHLFV